MQYAHALSIEAEVFGLTTSHGHPHFGSIRAFREVRIHIRSVDLPAWMVSLELVSLLEMLLEAGGWRERTFVY